LGKYRAVEIEDTTKPKEDEIVLESYTAVDDSEPEDTFELEAPVYEENRVIWSTEDSQASAE
ncbi:MAG: hypothetical protein IJV74_05470, partial [Clostridia bacterium]|nr:hypothetical protein [Clostridia bacterium]